MTAKEKEKLVNGQIWFLNSICAAFYVSPPPHRSNKRSCQNYFISSFFFHSLADQVLSLWSLKIENFCLKCAKINVCCVTSASREKRNRDMKTFVISIRNWLNFQTKKHKKRSQEILQRNFLHNQIRFTSRDAVKFSWVYRWFECLSAVVASSFNNEVGRRRNCNLVWFKFLLWHNNLCS